MGSRGGHIVFHLLVSNERIRDHLYELLRRNQYQPRVSAGLDELLGALKGRHDAIVLLDSEAVAIYGLGIYAKVKAALSGNRIILLCDQAHRDLIQEAMQQGSYGCILEPYAEWEVLTMVRHILSDIRPVRGRSEVRKKKM
jgi:DNA-binding NtrC family response regulator